MLHENLIFLTDLFCPAVAGIFFIYYGLYFLQVSQGEARWQGRGFGFYLLFFGVFLIGRPVQLLLGPHPWPLIINCLRYLLFLGVCAPLLLGFALSLSKRRSRKRHLFTVGIGLSLVYVFFNVMGTVGSEVILRLGDLALYDNHTPALLGPWFAREVTQAVPIFAGLSFYGIATWLTLRDARAHKRAGQPYRQLLGFGLGTLIFLAALIVGVAFKAWWFYYVASVPSAALMGYGVLADIRQIKQRMNRVMPFVREELFHVLTTGADDNARLAELMELLGKSDMPDTVLVVEQDFAFASEKQKKEDLLDARRRFSGLLRERLKHQFSDHFLIIPVGAGRFAVCLSSQHDQSGAITQAILAVTHGDIGSRFFIGIGQNHDTHDLQRSYFEALSAVRFARDQQKPFATYEEISDISSTTQYPGSERDELMNEIRCGNKTSVLRRLDLFLDRLTALCDAEPTALRNRLNDVLGLLVNAAVDNVADASRVFEISDEARAELLHLKRVDDLLGYFRGIVGNLPLRPVIDQLGGGVEAVDKVRSFIQEKFKEDVTLERAARAAGISASHLQRRLKEENETFSGLLTKTRLAKARELLATNREPISQIAFQVGFHDSNYFSTVFKRYEGITPRQFRLESVNRQ